jgi:hypothetical protein
MPVCEILTVDCWKGIKQIECDWRTTLASAVFQWDDGRQRGIDGDRSVTLQHTAILHADVPTLALAEKLGMTVDAETVSGAADSGHESIVNYLIKERHCAMPSYAGDYAAETGNLGMLKCLSQNKYIFTRDTCSLAAAAGHLSALQYILHSLEVDDRQVISDWFSLLSVASAAHSGNIEMVQWLQQRYGWKLGRSVMATAIRSGQTAMCQYLISQQQHPLCFFDCVEAASCGHLDTLMWLCEQGCSMMYDPEAMLHAAAKGGCTAVMEYVLQQGVVSEYVLQKGVVSDSAHLTDMLQAAGAYKRLAAAQWLRQQGAEWPDSLTYYWRGRCKRWKGEVLAWARAQGCTASQDTGSEYGSGSDSDD